MNINTNVGLRDRSRVTLSGFKGLDTLSTSVDVSAIHSTEMQNLISRDGVNHKRYGWQTKCRIRDDSKYLKIQGIFNFTIYGINFFIAYAGKKFWLINKETWGFTDITTKSLDNDGKPTNENNQMSLVDSAILEDVECKCYVNNNKAYFVGCGDYLVFGKYVKSDNNTSTERFELRRVVGNEDVYIPTTTENIAYEGMLEPPQRITAEERNLLSPYTYNTLIGKDEVKEGESLTYYLDTKNFDNLEIEIEDGSGAITILKNESNGTITGTTYKVGDKMTTVKFETNSLLVNTATFLIKPYNSKWKNKEDIIEDGFPMIYEKANDENLSILHEEYVKENSSTRITFSGYINLIEMESGDKLAIQLNQKGYGETKEYEIDDEKSFFYKLPNIMPKLVYIKNDGQVKEIMSLDKENFSIEIAGEYENNLTFKVMIKEMSISFSLSSENAVIKSFNLDTNELFSSAGGTLSFGDYCTAEIESGKLTFNAQKDKPNAYKPFVPENPNIKVKIYKKQDNTIITSAINSTEFGTLGANDRLFVVDNTGNTIRWSKDNDFTYFGDKSWATCGTTEKKIKGLDRLNDSTLIIAKEYSIREPSIYILSGQIESGTNEAGTRKLTSIFTPHGYKVGMGAVGEVINFNGDCLMIANDGVYAISLGENMAVDSRYILHRSRQISNKLEKYNLANAKCIAYNGKFFVAVGGENKECYVADNKYTSSFKGDMQNAVNYEWWRWTNIPVSVWGFVDDKLWFGTEDGQLCTFSEKFYDETKHFLNETTMGLPENNGLPLSESIKANEGDSFTFTNDAWGKLTTENFKVEDGKTKFYLPLSDYIDKEIIKVDGKEFAIKKENTYFSIDYQVSTNEVEFSRNYANKQLIVSKVVDNVIFLKTKDEKVPTWETPITRNGVLSHKDIVIAKWISGAMDLGTRAYSKTLTFFNLTGEKELANRLKYGIKTLLTRKDFEFLRANNDLDFEKLDLETLSLDSFFASSYAKRLNIRNVNFIMLYFMSDIDEDMAINSVQIEFKLYKKNIGVR